MKKLNIILALILVSLAGIVSAQTYQIRTVNKGAGVVGIEMRETSGTGTPQATDWVCDIVFGITWDTSYKVDLGAITTSFAITKAGTRTTKGAKHFQAFYANNTPYNFPANWVQNTWVEIASIPNTLAGTGTGTFEIASPSFHSTTDPNINVSLINDYTPTVNGSASGVPLPLNLLNFEGKTAGDVSMLNWETATEENFSHFELEHSTSDGSFVKLSNITGHGNSTQVQKYNYIHFKPNSGINYYRLKMVDFDGKYSYSQIIRLDFKSLNNTTLKVYPNPSTDYVMIKSENIIEKMRVVNSLGMVILENSNGKIIDVSSLATGSYYIALLQDNNWIYKKFMKN